MNSAVQPMLLPPQSLDRNAADALMHLMLPNMVHKSLTHAIKTGHSGNPKNKLTGLKFSRLKDTRPTTNDDDRTGTRHLEILRLKQSMLNSLR